MKTYLVKWVLLLAATGNLLLLPATAEVRFSAGIEINATADFYEPLTPHGGWVEVGSYGRCWHPTVAAGWRPYTTGHWEWTDVGWYWVSDEPWAWACYHYGSWVYDASYGWVWVPGVEWAPSWVVWRESPDYIGWAPYGPAGVVLAPSFFVFVDVHRFREPIRPDRVIVNNTTIINRTTVVNNFSRETRTIEGTSQTVVVNKGPSVATIQKATGGRLEATPVTQLVRNTPVPSNVKRGAVKEQQTAEPTRTGNERQRTYQQAPTAVAPTEPQRTATPPSKEKKKTSQPAEPRTAPLVPQRPQPPAQATPVSPPGPPTGAERGYSRERGATPPAEAGPKREALPARETPPRPPGPPAEKERGKGQDKEKEHP